MDEAIHFPSILDELITKFVKTPRRLEDSGSTVGGGGGGGSGFSLYWPIRGAAALKGTFFRLQEYERCGFNKLKYTVYERVGTSGLSYKMT